MTLHRKRFLLVGPASLALLVAGVFAPVLGFGFVRWDDDINLTQNPLLTEPWSWSLAGKLFDAGQALRFKPVHWLVDRAFHGLVGFDPAGWHALNLALHLVATLLFFAVLRRLLARVAPEAGGVRADAAAGLVAALWAVHPLRAETVAWATASPYPLTAVWLLGSFGCYLAANESAAGTGRRRAWFVAAWLLAVAAYGTYPIAATYGLWLIAVDVWWLRIGPARGAPAHAWFAWAGKHAAFLAPAAAATAVTLATRLAQPGIFTEAPTLDSVGLPLRAAMALATLADFVVRFVRPIDLTPNLPAFALDGATLVRLALLAGAAVAVLAWSWARRRTQPRLALVVVGFAARRQAEIWRDSGTLFAAMERHPHFKDNARQAGHVYVLWARDEAARGHPRRAAELFGRARATYLDAIKAALARPDYDEALSLLTHIEHHLGLTPDLRREKGAWLLHAGRPAEAVPELRAAVAAMPADARAQALLAEAEAGAAR